MNNKGLIKEIFVMTLADAITAIAVSFPGTKATHRSAVFRSLELFWTHFFIPLPLSVITMALNIPPADHRIYFLR